VVALSVAALLAVFLLYTSIAGGGTASLQPSQLRGHDGSAVQLAGRVVAPVSRNGRTLRFGLRDVKGTATVPVVYTGSVSDQFRVGRDVYLKGRLTHGTFVGEKDSLVTKCPSKYTAKASSGGA
jgi:cytochrome c-type biogenesis protein CcmE